MATYASESKDSINDYINKSTGQYVIDDPNELRQLQDAATRHAAGVVIASCQAARANRQTEANLLMLAIAVIAIPRVLHWSIHRNRKAEQQVAGGENARE
ncbi:MAG: hypothetical protein FWF02_10500 [Micrococcales bacterium]|nr:hypothetical protein [Micrococcales bacterium]MCL2668116.1 hypothetical protein [Micrococcales bacterium]